MAFKLKWRWSLLTALSVWIVSAAIYGAGLVTWKDVTLAHTFIWPAVIFAALLPFSFAKLVNSKWLMPVAAVWSGAAFPGVYIGGSWIMGWTNHCGKICALGGVVIFLAFAGLGVIHEWSRIAAFVRRRLVHSIQTAAV